MPVTILNPKTAAQIGAGLIECWECGGDGDWGKFMPEPEPPGQCPCVVCKGTGLAYISM